MRAVKVAFATFLCVGLGIFVWSIVNMEVNYRKYHSKDLFSVSFDSVLVKNANTMVRGVILLDGIGYISFNSELIANPQGFEEWEGNKRSSSPIKPTIWDVPFPIYVSKKGNTDTLLVIKDTFHLYFRLEKGGD